MLVRTEIKTMVAAIRRLPRAADEPPPALLPVVHGHFVNLAVLRDDTGQVPDDLAGLDQIGLGLVSADPHDRDRVVVHGAHDRMLLAVIAESRTGVVRGTVRVHTVD